MAICMGYHLIYILEFPEHKFRAKTNAGDHASSLKVSKEGKKYPLFGELGAKFLKVALKEKVVY